MQCFLDLIYFKNAMFFRFWFNFNKFLVKTTKSSIFYLNIVPFPDKTRGNYFHHKIINLEKRRFVTGAQICQFCRGLFTFLLAALGQFSFEWDIVCYSWSICDKRGKKDFLFKIKLVVMMIFFWKRKKFRLILKHLLFLFNFSYLKVWLCKYHYRTLLKFRIFRI